MLEGLWGAPVLGWLDESLPARRMFDLLAPAQTPSAELVADLADAFSQSLTSPALCHIAHRAPSWPIPSAVELAGRLKVVKVNVDEAPGVSARFAVQGIPTLLVLRDGNPVARQVGALPPDQLLGWLRGVVGH